MNRTAVDAALIVRCCWRRPINDGWPCPDSVVVSRADRQLHRACDVRSYHLSRGVRMNSQYGASVVPLNSSRTTKLPAVGTGRSPRGAGGAAHDVRHLLRAGENRRPSVRANRTGNMNVSRPML